MNQIINRESTHRGGDLRRMADGALLALAILVVAGLVVIPSASSAARSTPEGAVAVSPPDTTPLPVWRLSHDDGTVHLLGSIHVLHPEAYPLHEDINEAFDRSEIVAFELDFAEDLDLMVPLMRELGTFADGRTLQDVLPPALHSGAIDALTSMGVPGGAAQAMKPWVAALQLPSLALLREGYDSANGIDLHFFRRAQEQEKRVVGLETAREQFEMLDSLDMDVQARWLRWTLDQLEGIDDQFDQFTRHWRCGNVEEMARAVTQPLRAHPELRVAMLDERNRKWIPKIEDLMDSTESAIVIVGMGHLVGEGSVVDLLREAGYAVEQLRRRTAPESSATEDLECSGGDATRGTDTSDHRGTRG